MLVVLGYPGRWGFCRDLEVARRFVCLLRSDLFILAGEEKVWVRNNSLTLEIIDFKLHGCFGGWRCRKRPRPGQHLYRSVIRAKNVDDRMRFSTYITGAHTLREITPEANVVGEFLSLYPHLYSSWTPHIPTKHSCPSHKSVMSLNLPPLDGGFIEDQSPQRTQKENCQSKHCQGIGKTEYEKM